MPYDFQRENLRRELAPAFRTLCSPEVPLTDMLFGEDAKLKNHMKQAELGDKLANKSKNWKGD